MINNNKKNKNTTLIRDRDEILNKDFSNILEKIQIRDDKKYFEKLCEKAKITLETFFLTEDKKDLAELEEILEFIKITKGWESLWDIREEMKKEKGLFWKRFMVKM